ncbi:hypothetical protein MPTK1_4g17580 [Marchantia polymorpha subsp. ruderalis]|uniref:Uncharacterized protein n=2 Tax=Marchantia polymorpha TaxID=3197 RepID=A0AAF6BAW6_MARPO|nr:hypothetical protein MARPO_0041s0040 [Marchantia polymorpha]BBN09150.1 hypothetical protein Mp_4g17580 [Marchantia polymorpha subsp. ruderalis]|eukprot:PTQ40138.1 hypothetical protein MARPO_0041s0040 [Marchantia polymorpha]
MRIVNPQANRGLLDCSQEICFETDMLKIMKLERLQNRYLHSSSSVTRFFSTSRVISHQLNGKTTQDSRSFTWLSAWHDQSYILTRQNRTNPALIIAKDVLSFERG